MNRHMQGKQETEEQKLIRQTMAGYLRKNPPNGFTSEAEQQAARLMPKRLQGQIKALARKHPSVLHDVDLEGRTPLHWLARYQAPELIEEFLALGADPLANHRVGFFPLEEACYHSRGPALRILHQASAQGIRALVEDGRHACGEFTPASAAAFCSNAAALRDILDWEPDANRPDPNGNAPIHLLCSGAKTMDRALPCLTALMDAGADLWVLNSKGQNPLEIAIQAKNALAAPLQALWDQKHLRNATPKQVPRAPKRSL